ncbi:MAG: hypothetical protein RLZZ04_4552 [Cyanobacteriota bacterium]|jgi:hypothetical protein
MQIKYNKWLIAIAFMTGLIFYSPFSKSIKNWQNSSVAIAENNSQTDNTILIWKVGSPYEGDTPEADIPSDLRQRAKQLNAQIVVETFPAKGFTARLRAAIKDHREPDILSSSNYAVLDVADSDLGNFKGINSIDGVEKSLVFVNRTLDSLQPDLGWSVLLNSSGNYNVARQLALPEPKCGDDTTTKLLGEIDSQMLEKLATDASQAYIEPKPEFNQHLSQESLMKIDKSSALTNVKQTLVCSIVANKNLAAVSTISSYTGTISAEGNYLGHSGLLSVFRRENTHWRLLTIISNEEAGPYAASPYLDKLAKLIENSDDSSGSTPQPATNLFPDNRRPVVESEEKQEKQSENFTWQPSTDPNVVAEITEFISCPSPNYPNYQCESRLYPFFDQKNPANSMPEDWLYTTDGGTWRWRVWSLAADGSIAFSTTQTFKDPPLQMMKEF